MLRLGLWIAWVKGMSSQLWTYVCVCVCGRACVNIYMDVSVASDLQGFGQQRLLRSFKHCCLKVSPAGSAHFGREVFDPTHALQMLANILGSLICLWTFCVSSHCPDAAMGLSDTLAAAAEVPAAILAVSVQKTSQLLGWFCKFYFTKRDTLILSQMQEMTGTRFQQEVNTPRGVFPLCAYCREESQRRQHKTEGVAQSLRVIMLHAFLSAYTNTILKLRRSRSLEPVLRPRHRLLI